MNIDWDAANLDEIRRHGLTLEQVERALHGRLMIVRAAYVRSGETRTALAGATSTGRIPGGDNHPSAYGHPARDGFPSYAAPSTGIQEQGAMTAPNGKEERDEQGRILVDDPSEIPAFDTDKEELEYWRSHTPSDKFFAQAESMDLEDFARRETETGPRQP